MHVLRFIISFTRLLSGLRLNDEFDSTVFELIVVYGMDSSAAMTISVFMAVHKYYDQNSLFPR